jgi:hypothetical protein
MLIARLEPFLNPIYGIYVVSHRGDTNANFHTTTGIKALCRMSSLLPASYGNLSDSSDYLGLTSIMAPVVCKSTYLQHPLFDPQGGVLHIKDIVQMDDKYLHRTSDLVTGMLLLGANVGAITKTQACYFKVTFLPHLRLRTSVYQHHGEAFIGPDGGAVTIDDVVFGGGEQLAAGKYTLDTVHQDPDYDEWLSCILYRGKTDRDANYIRNGEEPPKRDNNGMALTGWRACGETEYPPIAPGNSVAVGVDDGADEDPMQAVDDSADDSAFELPHGFEPLTLAPAPGRTLVEHIDDMLRQAESAAGLPVGTRTNAQGEVEVITLHRQRDLRGSF